MNKKNLQAPDRSSIGIWMLVAAMACLSPAAWGEDGRLSVDMASGSPRVRSNAPVTIFLKTFWNGSSIIEGHFEIRYLADGALLRAEHKSHDLVLTPGEQTIRLTLPTAGSMTSFSRDEIAVKFVTADQTFDLKRYPLISSLGERAMNICVVGPTDRASQGDVEAELLDAFRLGELLAKDLPPGSISTVQTRWDTIDVPELALHFCSFDMVLLRPEGFASLRKKQLDALLAWARAGGSVGVLLSKDLGASHVEFLNQLVAQTGETPFVLNLSGEFTVDANSAEDGIWQANVELGRAAVIDLEELPTDLESVWLRARKVAGFLWKVRRDRRGTLSLSRAELEDVEKQASAARAGKPPKPQVPWLPIASTGEFVSKLMPEDVRVVPMSLVGLMLLVYLLLIGPFDYYVLGHFKIRRFTWVTFPLMTALVAWLCVTVSGMYLTSNSSGRTLIIRDMGAQGEVLRETRFELKFLARRSQVKTEVNNEIFTPIDQQRLTLNSQYAYQYQYGGQVQDLDSPAQYTGRIPTNYEVSQVVPQWRPQVNRLMAIAPDREKSEFDWQDSDLIEERNSAKLRMKVKEVWPNASVTVFQGKKRDDVVGREVFQVRPVNKNHPYYWHHQHSNHGHDTFTESLCRRERNGLFRFVSQLAPNAGDNFEDLTLLDTSDRNQALLVIAVEEADELVLYRRLFTTLNKK